MDKNEFYKKLALIIVEKGLLVILISVVGYWINISLKRIDHQNQLQLEEEIANREETERQFKFFMETLTHTKKLEELKEQGKINKERDSLKSALRTSEINRVNDYQKYFLNQKQEFEEQQLAIQKNHEKELIAIEAARQKALQSDFLHLQSSLNEGLEQVRSDLGLMNQLSLQSTEKIAKIWNKIYELDYKGENLIRAIIEFDKNKKQLYSIPSGRPASLFGWRERKILKIKKEYVNEKKEIQTILRTEQFWLTEKAIQNVNQYLKVIDAIADAEKANKFRFLFPEFKYANDKIIVSEQRLDSLINIKNTIRKTIFSEGQLARNAL